MVNIKEHETFLLLEEVMELIEAATKLQSALFKNLRFGVTVVNPLTGKTSVESITIEANDALATI